MSAEVPALPPAVIAHSMVRWACAMQIDLDVTLQPYLWQLSRTGIGFACQRTSA